MTREQQVPHGYEDTPAYKALNDAGVLTTTYRRKDVSDIFTGVDVRANATQQSNMMARLKSCWCIPGIGCCLYNMSHIETFVPAGHVGFLMGEQNEYLFMQPGMHNIGSIYMRKIGDPRPLRGHIQHGNRTIVIVEQGFVGFAMDNGQPVLLPPGIHVWTSESLYYDRAVPLDNHIVDLGPMTLVTVDEGYAAVTQNNGKQTVLQGGHTHLLTHKNWKFEKFISLKIQTDELEKIQATSADNINMSVTSTVNWRIVDVEVAATMAAETMATTGKAGSISADITKLRRDVLKQALASLAAFIGAVNYSESFHMSAAAAGTQRPNEKPVEGVLVAQSTKTAEHKFVENPMYDIDKMDTSVAHANRVTRTYGVEIMSINIISASPIDAKLTTSLASGAVASAEALQAETAARGKANAVRIAAEAEAARVTIEAKGIADAEIIKAEAQAQGVRAVAAAVQSDGGHHAMGQRVAEMYVGQLAEMAKHSKMMIVPDKPNDIAGVLSTAFGISETVHSAVRGSTTAQRK
eukprot:CAMPEP_0119315806 /NCGR_PEP_ID=MMETSP1333-20130426/37246_1 /TAXON_ID=418940 /ORGANISM="Scyphosphaera apsteinii, Strain RCC1455" /LENGTH=521 /DNA_ID=CAMNT_0007321273 /DNA_START=39 /DNA_END=1604 /DNA_ORIENTATION=+